MGVDTHGLEALRNSAENIAGDPPGSTYIKTMNGWLFQRVGRKVEASYPDSVTTVYSFTQDEVQVYELTVINDGSGQFLSAERTG